MGGDAEDALDGGGVADADLDVALAAKAGGGVEALAFHEDAADGVEGGFTAEFPTGMEEVDDSAVQLAVEIIFAAAVFGQGRT
jgi:hypothetical protein